MVALDEAHDPVDGSGLESLERTLGLGIFAPPSLFILYFDKRPGQLVQKMAGDRESFFFR